MNKKRKEILDLVRTRHELSISICGDADMVPGESEILSETRHPIGTQRDLNLNLGGAYLPIITPLRKAGQYDA